MSEPTFASGLIGVVLDGRYRLDAVLGEGGMGAVFRAHHLAMDRRVAVKLLKPHLVGDDAALKRFQREARGTFKVESPHAVKVLDYGITELRDYYIVLEYLDGRTVQRELEVDGVFSPARVAHVATQALDALAAAHRVGLVHRNLKPENILLMRSGGDADYTKVLDFGVAKLMDGSMSPAMSALVLTQQGMVFGTPEFMSPEQACGHALDGRSDLYSLAATMFAMLTGRGLFDCFKAIEWLTKHAMSPPPHLADVMPELARYRELDALLQRCLAKRREQRPDTAEALAAELARIAPTLDPAYVAAAPEVTAAMPAAVMPAPAPPAPPIVPTGPTAPRPAAMRATMFATSSQYVAALPMPPSMSGAIAVPPADALAPTPNGTGMLAPTSTGTLVLPRSRSRGLWLAVGALAVVGVIGVAIALAVGRKSSGSTSASITQDAATVAVIAPVAAPDAAVAAAPPPVDAAAAIAAVATPPVDAAAAIAAVAPPPIDAAAITAVAPMPHPAAAVAPKHPAPAAVPVPPPHHPAPTVAASGNAHADAIAHVKNADLARNAGNHLRELAEADLALRTDPSNSRARFLLGDALIATGDLDRGCKYLHQLGSLPTAVRLIRVSHCP